jgi:hypothetical protein
MLLLNASSDTTRPTHLPPPPMTDPRLIALSSNPGQVEPGPFSEHDLREQWNAQADEFNQWESLNSAEQLAWAQTRAIASVKFPRLARLMQEPTAFELGELPPPAAAKPVNLVELHDPDFSDGLTASQHLDVLRGGPDPRTAATASPELPKPETERILKLAEILEEVDGRYDTYPEDAEALLQGRLWTPALLGPALWLTANDLSTISIATNVSQWRDKSGFDRHFGTGNANIQKAILAHPGFSGCHDGPVAPAALEEVNELVAALEADAECVAAEQPNLMQLTDKQLTRIAQLLKASAQPADADPDFSPASAAHGVLADRYEFSVLDSDDCEQAGGSAPTLDDAIREGRNYLRQYNQDGPHKLELRRVLVLNHSEATNA